MADFPGILAGFGPALPRAGLQVGERVEVFLSDSSW